VAPILFLLGELGSNYFSLLGKLTSKVGPSCTGMDVSLGEVNTCSLGKSQPQFQGKGARSTQNLRNSQFCPRMIVIMHEKAMFPLQNNFLVQCSHLPGGRERELGKNPLHSAMCGSKEKRKPLSPNGNTQGENP